MGATAPVACLKFIQMQQTTLGNGVNIMTKIQQLPSNVQSTKLGMKGVKFIHLSQNSF